MTLQKTITNLLPVPVARIIHLRDDLFLVGYGAAIIEIRDLSKEIGNDSEVDEPIASFSATGSDKFEYMRDFDCKDGDESKIVILFDSGAVGFLNLTNNTFMAKDLKDTNWVQV